VLKHSSTGVAVASDAPASSVAGPPQEGRDWRGQVKEDKMKVLTTDDLLRCTKAELCDLYRQTEHELAEAAEGTLDREIVLINRHAIRRALARLDIVF
jgi:hypothetical protein